MPHSCSHCDIIIRPFISIEITGATMSYARLPHTPRDALHAVRDGCPLFNLLLEGYCDSFRSDKDGCDHYSIANYFIYLSSEFQHRIPSRTDLIRLVSHLAMCQSKQPFFVCRRSCPPQDTAYFRSTTWSSSNFFLSTLKSKAIRTHLSFCTEDLLSNSLLWS